MLLRIIDGLLQLVVLQTESQKNKNPFYFLVSLTHSTFSFHVNFTRRIGNNNGNYGEHKLFYIYVKKHYYVTYYKLAFSYRRWQGHCQRNKWFEMVSSIFSVRIYHRKETFCSSRALLRGPVPFLMHKNLGIKLRTIII